MEPCSPLRAQGEIESCLHIRREQITAEHNVNLDNEIYLNWFICLVVWILYWNIGSWCNAYTEWSPWPWLTIYNVLFRARSPVSRLTWRTQSNPCLLPPARKPLRRWDEYHLDQTSARSCLTTRARWTLSSRTSTLPGLICRELTLMMSCSWNLSTSTHSKLILWSYRISWRLLWHNPVC